MRINRLDLTRYGKFTDSSIDFGPRSAEPDFHIIYGPNEAGKSTLLAAYLDLLFGIKNSTPYNFLHSYESMRIGAQLELQGEATDIVRLKKAKNSLLNASDQVLPDSSILTDLSGVDREGYRSMFSLDEATLQSGGENILASQGDLGELLFSASAGIVDIGHTLKGLRDQSDKFYRKRASKSLLVQQKKRLKELQEQFKAKDTLASEYARISESKNMAKSRYEQALEQRGQDRAMLKVLERQYNALPQLNERNDLLGQLVPLRALPDCPLGAEEKLKLLQLEDKELATERRGVADESENIDEEISGLVFDDSILLAEGDIERLQNLCGRYQNAAEALPALRQRLRDSERVQQNQLNQIECDEQEASNILLSVSITARLRELMEQYAAIHLRRCTAEEELSRDFGLLEVATSNLRRITLDLEVLESSNAPVAILRDTLARARTVDHSYRVIQAKRDLESCNRVWEEQRGELIPWEGDEDDLRGLSIPNEETLVRWAAIQVRQIEEINHGLKEVDNLEASLRRGAAQIHAIEDSSGVLTDQQATDIRNARSAAWEHHYERLDQTSADAFAMTLSKDDSITQARMNDAESVAELRQLIRAQALLSENLNIAREAYSLIVDAQAATQEEIAAAVANMSTQLPLGFTVDNIRLWLSKRVSALDAHKSLLAAIQALKYIQEDYDAITTELGKALSHLNVSVELEVSIEGLVQLAQEVLDQTVEWRSLREDVAKHREAHCERENALEAIDEVESQWSEAWARTCSDCWFGAKESVPDVSWVREALPILDDLRASAAQRTAEEERVINHEQDQQALSEALSLLMADLERPMGTPVLACAQALLSELDEVQAASQRRENARARKKDVERRSATLIQREEEHNDSRDAFFSQLQASSYDDSARVLQHFRDREHIEGLLKRVEADLMSSVDAPTLDQAVLVLSELNRADIEVSMNTLGSNEENLDVQVRELFSEYSDAKSRLEGIGGDDEVARLEEQRSTIIEHIKSEAVQYLSIKLGVTAAEQALHEYRDIHRSAMMKQASEAFKCISRGAYSGLTTQPDNSREILVAVSAETGSKVASDLSTGTRFQLYLALRVAGYLEFAKTQPSVPFIADDIMETFDDHRSEEAFKLLSSMAEVGQVIYLTHHKHLCDIAQSACPGVKIHQLGA